LTPFLFLFFCKTLGNKIIESISGIVNPSTRYGAVLQPD
jgi:hypothetical protein